jgi:diguanylate cyclase (GGDEF)-like protein
VPVRVVLGSQRTPEQRKRSVRGLLLPILGKILAMTSTTTTPEIRKAARIVGLREFNTPSLEAVERRRLQLWLVMAVMVLSLAGVAVVSSLWAFDQNRPAWLSPVIMRASVVALSVGFCIYAFEKELHLRRLTFLLSDERVLTAALTNRLREVSALLEAGKAVNSALELQHVLDVILRSALELLEGETGSIMMLEGRRRLRVVAVKGNDNLRGEEVELGAGVAGYVAEEMEPLLITGEADRSMFRNLAVRAQRVESGMSVPLVSREEVLGVINLNAAPGRQFTEYDLRAVSLFAEHAAVAITNARLYEMERAHTAELTYRAFHDPLTRLANRALFVERVEEALAENVGSPRRVAVLFLDLDNFKTVNDSLGHAAGDRLLVAVAGRIEGSLGHADIAARFGGDEFAVLLHDAVDDFAVTTAANRILESLRSPFSIGGHEVFIGASIGIALPSGEDETVDELLRNADVAMYMAKDGGKGRFAVFAPEMHEAAVERMELEADLQRAVKRGEFVVHYQPTVELATSKVTGMEALVRWEHPSKGLLAPADFIPLAEETGLILPIGRWVLHEACRQAVAWSDEYPSRVPLTMSVNLSARQLQLNTVIDDVAAALDETGLDPGRLTLELTETVLMQDGNDVIARLHQLKELGVQLAIDDFGTGYSSLSYLHRFPIDVLKIDKSFTGNLRRGTGEGVLTHAIIRLARTLHLRTVAEGIERPDQVGKLQAMGCHSGQGFYFAQPLPADEAIEKAYGELARHTVAVGTTVGNGTDSSR